MKMYLFLLLLFSCTRTTLQAEEWKILEATVEGIPENNYYQIELSHEMIGFSVNRDLTDLRLYNSTGEETPYFIRSEEMSREIKKLVTYEIIQKSAKDSLNELIIHNPEKELIEKLWIVSRPAEVSKWIQVKGSNDRSNWFIVKEYQDMTSLVYKESGNEIIPVSIPGGNYLYYEINIRNTQQSPLDILYVAKKEIEYLRNDFSALPLFPIAQKDSTNKLSYISFPGLPQNYRYQKVVFYITYPSDYYRQVIVLPGEQYSFPLSSNSENTYTLSSGLLTPASLFRIQNENNPPLQVDSIRFYGSKQYICAFLSAGESYTIIIDKKQASRPAYDIEHFRNKIPTDIPVIKTTSQLLVNKTTEENKRKPLWIEQPAVLWSIILGVGLFLGIICWRVLREVKKKE